MTDHRPMPWDKRLTDLCVALVLMVVLAPLMLGIALCIRLRDGGLFRWPRDRSNC